MLDFWARYTLDKVFETPDGWEVQNMLTTGAMITRAALHRTCSIGTHTLDTEQSEQDRSRCFEHVVWTRGVESPIHTTSICAPGAKSSGSVELRAEPEVNPSVSDSP